MKVLQVIPTLGLAGAERMLEALALGLAAGGDEVLVVDLYDKDTPITRNLEAHGVPVAHLGKRRGLDLSMCPKIARVLREFRPDVVHTHRYAVRYAHPVDVMHGVDACVHTVHNVANQEVGDADQWLCRRFYKSGKLVPVGINETVAASVAELYGLELDDVPLVYNGVARPLATGANPLGEDHRFTFVHVGRFAEAKNHVGLVEGFARFHAAHPDTRLALVGDGPLRESVRSQIESLGAGGFIRDVGLVDAMGDVYANADAFVFPSLYEGMSLSLVEAMMSGLPVLASDKGGNADLVSDGDTGYVCDVDPESIERGLERIYLDEGRVDVATRGAASVERFSDDAMTEAYRALYERLLGAEGVRRS